MAYRGESKKTKLISRLAAQAQRKAGNSRKAELGRFIRQYHAHTAPEELFDADEASLLGGALSMWGRLQKRKSGMPSIRVYNPDISADGWSHPHTVIEIITDDMPFLVDSVTEELNRHALTVHQVIHPVIAVQRDKTGQLTGVGGGPKDSSGMTHESVMHVEINEQSLPETLRKLEKDLGQVLRDVRAAVKDWCTMRGRVADVIAELDSQAPSSVPAAEVEEAKAFLHWIDDNNFTFLGYREYDFRTQRKKSYLDIRARSGLGLLRSSDMVVFDGMTHGSPLPAEIADFVHQPTLVQISKANRRSTVHRSVHLDTIGIKLFNKAGEAIGERLFVGLFTSAAYNKATRDIPLIRRKVDSIVERSGVTPGGHDGKALLNILETLPRDELLQVDEDALFNTAMGVLHLQERQRVAMFVHRDPFERFVSCLVYVPRDRFDTDLRLALQSILEEGFAGEVTAFYTQVSESVLARLHFIIKTTPGNAPPMSVEKIEARLAQAARDWRDDLAHELTAEHGEQHGTALFRLFGGTFPAGYRATFSPRQATHDIAKIEQVLRLGTLHCDLYRAPGAPKTDVQLKIYNREEPVPLSDVLPMLENLGLRVINEAPHEIYTPDAGGRVWIHDFGMRSRSGGAIDVKGIKSKFESAFVQVWDGDIEDDGFNQLVTEAGLEAREAVILRAYCKYLLQAAIPFSQQYMEDTLAQNTGITRGLVALFSNRFDPALYNAKSRKMTTIRQQILAALDTVENLDQDRIMRRFLNVIEASLRTNFYQPDASGNCKTYVSIKIDSHAVEELPLPRPHVEIFVYSPRMEGVHLRGGRIARGGIRWSDRREDFRTEILGLMKSQMTKNAVIVPVGSKGGFVVKRPPAGDREAMQREGIACYSMLMQGLLDITDNLEPGKVIYPDHVVRHDGDDPYLVVAADKGTATFSDIANGIARDYGFWLDDAFASGGSAGYDHKKMGITARGAWESVKRHFREIGINTQTTDFSVIGVGDMAGDVFGNGMLLSKHICLKAAFNHLHIFIDPTPDAATSFKERKRLFRLTRSSWSDYNQNLISKGGGIFDRSAKSIKITPEMRAALDLPARQTMTPNDLIRAILKSPVDLLWFGGIGTYVKATQQSHGDAGDRANDSLRVNAPELGCKVIGEGANLGVTQSGRVEYALGGGRINTDFIDNSAGVGCSDHEVNIKILTGDVIAGGKMTLAQRDKLLVSMTDEVADLVLMDNYRQTMALSHAEVNAAASLDSHSRFMRQLEKENKLNRAVEFLPDDDALIDRAAANKGLTRAELSVLLAYAKIDLYEELLDSDLPDDPYLKQDIGLYFPAPLRQKYASQIAEHRLQREISATYLTNSLVNRAGPTFITEIGDVTGRSSADIARAYLVTRQVFSMHSLWGRIEALDNKVSADIQAEMNVEIAGLIERGTHWFLKNGAKPMDITRAISSYRNGVAALAAGLGGILSPELKKSADAATRDYTDRGAPAPLAREIASLGLLTPACDIVNIARGAGSAVPAVGKIYFNLGARFGLDWLRLAANGIVPETEWQKIALETITEDLYAQQTRLTTGVIDAAGGTDAAEGVIDAWAAAKSYAVSRSQELIGEIRSSSTVDLAMLTVASREIEALVSA